MQILPAIDIRGGKCVRLTQGDYQQETIYGSSPADMAHRWVAEGATGLHIVDLDAARQGQSENRAAIAKIIKEVCVPCHLGGGIRSRDAVADYIELGLSKLVIGTKALADPQWLTDMCDAFPHQLMVAIDARDGRVTSDGWQQTSDVGPVELARRLNTKKLAGIIYTDIAKDGMLSGPNFQAMSEMADAVDAPLICSGGVTSVEDVSRLAKLGLAGCVIGRALYEGHLTMQNALAAATPQVPT